MSLSVDAAFAALPPHIDFMLHHQPHAIEQLAQGKDAGEISVLQSIALLDPRDWVSPEQLRKAIATNSFWLARWMAPDCSGVLVRAAADPDVLLADLGATAPAVT